MPVGQLVVKHFSLLLLESFPKTHIAVRYSTSIVTDTTLLDKSRSDLLISVAHLLELHNAAIVGVIVCANRLRTGSLAALDAQSWDVGRGELAADVLLRDEPCQYAIMSRVDESLRDATESANLRCHPHQFECQALRDCPGRLSLRTDEVSISLALIEDITSLQWIVAEGGEM